MKIDNNLISLQKFSGMVAMAMFFCTLAAFVDAMIGGLGGNSGTIELIPGEQFPISGPMPPKTDTLADFIIEGEPGDGSLQLVPEAVFSGYWFGGSMWRGVMVATAYSRADKWVIKVKDRFGEKQNPALVFTVQVYPDAEEKRRHSPSFLMRKSGISPYYFSVAFLLGGIITGAANFAFARRWSIYLGTHLCGEIFILKKEEGGFEATCELVSVATLHPGMRCTFYRRTGEIVGTGTILEQKTKSIRMHVDDDSHAKIGDIACFTSTPT